MGVFEFYALALRMKRDVHFKLAMEQIGGRTKTLKKLNSVVEQGISYNNPNEFKLLGIFKDITLLTDDKEVKENYDELMDYLTHGKQLTQDHIDFLIGKGLFENTEGGFISAIESEKNVLMQKAMLRYHLDSEKIEKMAVFFDAEAEKNKGRVSEEDIKKGLEKFGVEKIN